MAQAFSLANLRAHSDEVLVNLHDATARHTNVGVSYFLDELWRRETRHQTEEIRRLTRWIAAMTLVITVATLVNVGLFVLVI